MKPSALVLLSAGFEELEAVAPSDLLRRAGVEVVIASLGEERTVTGRNGISLIADTSLSAVFDRTFDCLLLPGGPGVKYLRADSRVVELVRRQYSQGRWIAAICAAPTLLKDAGIIPGIRFTAHPTAASDLPDSLTGERVVADGKVLTSRGAGTAIDFGIALTSALCGPTAAKAVGASVCA